MPHKTTVFLDFPRGKAFDSIESRSRPKPGRVRKASVRLPRPPTKEAKGKQAASGKQEKRKQMSKTLILSKNKHKDRVSTRDPHLAQDDRENSYSSNQKD